MKANLCRCNNCGTIMYDQNPQIGAKRYLVRNGKTHLNEKVEDMQYHRLGGDLEYFWACPICLTDEYLTDL